MPSTSVEEYLEALYKLRDGKRPVRPSKLAEHLGLKPASIAEMLKKLQEDRFVKRTPDQGVLLTAKGERLALKLIRKHRLSERFLTDALGIPWDKVHDEACKFEHVLSEEVEEGLDRFLESPESCPHGYPIPDKNGVIVEERVLNLSELPPRRSGSIVSVAEEDGPMLRYLASLGLVPKAKVKIEELAPFGGPLLVKVGSAKYAIAREVASKILVRETGGSAASQAAGRGAASQGATSHGAASQAAAKSRR